ncbi:unnamed protein product [Brassica rapa subsp. narinosa]
MASSAAPVDNAVVAVAYSTFESLRLGRTVHAVVGRLIRFSDSRKINKNGDFMGITILLLDELDSVIHGFIPANRASQYRPSFKTGSIVRLNRFEVTRVAHMYKITENQFVIGFIPSTHIVEVQTDAPVIKFETFMLKPYSNCFYDRDVTVYLSLRDEAASNFRGFLKAGDKPQSVMLVITVNPKLFGGNMYLNSTQGTRFFFDTNIPEITKFVSSVGATTAQAYTCVDTLQGIKKKELVSIEDLNSFISNSNEQVVFRLCLLQYRLMS